MYRLPGVTISSLAGQPTSIPEVDAICREIEHVLRQVCALKQPASLAGQVMISASGHVMATSFTDYRGLEGPSPSRLRHYAHLGRFLSPQDIVDEFRPRYRNVAKIFDANLLQNVLISNGKLSGILDWEDSGWNGNGMILRFRTGDRWAIGENIGRGWTRRLAPPHWRPVNLRMQF
ncbi:hypothetical protein DFH09DRAFT_924663 [Mycena vulgaris]|nr:hypothetical protein DFH09DRAFT_924663 [Mycena vulgaris]